MKNEKFALKMAELMELLEQGKGIESNSFSILINNNETLLMGLDKASLPLTNAIMLKQIDNKLEIIGHLDHKKYNPNKKALIAFDGRNPKSKKIFINIDEEQLYFDKKSNLNSKDKIYIFWQYGTDNCLIILGVNPVTNKNSIDIFMHLCSENNSKLKIIFIHLLELTYSTKIGGEDIE